MIAVEHLADVFVEIADTLVDDFDIIEFLEMVTGHSATMTNAASAGLLLAYPHGQLRFTAASRESVRLLELFQLQNDEGPCLDCFSSGARWSTRTSNAPPSGGPSSRRRRSGPVSPRCTPSRCATAGTSSAR